MQEILRFAVGDAIALLNTITTNPPVSPDGRSGNDRHSFPINTARNKHDAEKFVNDVHANGLYALIGIAAIVASPWIPGGISAIENLAARAQNDRSISPPV